MTYEKLRKLIEVNNIPQNVELLSDSGWECGPTQMDGVYYNARLNCIIFTQFYIAGEERFGFVALTDKNSDIKEKKKKEKEG